MSDPVPAEAVAVAIDPALSSELDAKGFTEEKSVEGFFKDRAKDPLKPKGWFYCPQNDVKNGWLFHGGDYALKPDPMSVPVPKTALDPIDAIATAWIEEKV